MANTAENEIVRNTLVKWKLQPRRPVQLTFDVYFKQGFRKTSQCNESASC